MSSTNLFSSRKTVVNSVTSFNCAFRFALNFTSASIECAIYLWEACLLYYYFSRRGHMTFHKSSRQFSSACDAIFPRIPNVHFLRAMKKNYKISIDFCVFSSFFFGRVVVCVSDSLSCFISSQRRPSLSRFFVCFIPRFAVLGGRSSSTRVTILNNDLKFKRIRKTMKIITCWVRVRTFQLFKSKAETKSDS